MKKSIFALVVCLAIISCSSPQPEHAAVPDKVSMAQEGGIKVAEGLLVSSNDTVCGMSIGNEPGDTVTINGKLFGFCSTGCKESYLAEHSAK